MVFLSYYLPGTIGLVHFVQVVNSKAVTRCGAVNKVAGDSLRGGEGEYLCSRHLVDGRIIENG